MTPMTGATGRPDPFGVADLSRHEAAKLIGVPRSVLQRARAAERSHDSDFRPRFIANTDSHRACPLRTLFGQTEWQKSLYAPVSLLPLCRRCLVMASRMSRNFQITQPQRQTMPVSMVDSLTSAAYPCTDQYFPDAPCWRRGAGGSRSPAKVSR